MDWSDFADLIAVAREESSRWSDAVVLGGVAIYQHAAHDPAAAPSAEPTSDLDLYLSLDGFTELRDQEEVVANRSATKHSYFVRGFPVDVYTEDHAPLPVPYAEIAARATICGGICVACLEHLLILKLEAFRVRRGTAKGERDARHIALLVGLILGRKASLALLSDELIQLVCAALHAKDTVDVRAGRKRPVDLHWFSPKMLRQGALVPLSTSQS